MLGAEEIRQRFPQFILQDGAEGYLEPGAGFLLPEKCIRAQLSVARANRAELRTGEKVIDIVTDASGVVVETNRARYGAASVVLAPGPWMAHWARTICGLEEAHFAVYRQTLYWFASGGIRAAVFAGANADIPVELGLKWRRGFMVFPAWTARV